MQEFVREKQKCVENLDFFSVPGIKMFFLKNNFRHHLAFFMGFLSPFMTFYVRPIFLVVMVLRVICENVHY